MKQQQIKYCRERAYQIYRDKKSDLNKKYRIEAIKLTEAEQIRMIRLGRVKMKPDNKIEIVQYSALKLRDVFDFSKYERDMDMAKGYEPALEKLDKAYNTLMDEIVLGDEHKALKLLEAFTKAH